MVLIGSRQAVTSSKALALCDGMGEQAYRQRVLEVFLGEHGRVAVERELPVQLVRACLAESRHVPSAGNEFYHIRVTLFVMLGHACRSA